MPDSAIAIEKQEMSRCYRVLYFDHTASMSGGEIALLHLIGALDRSRYIPLVVLGAEGPLVERLEALGVEVLVLPLDKNVSETRKDSLKGGGLLRLSAVWQSVHYALRLSRLMRSRKADLVHTNSLKSDVIGGIAARLARVPVIWHVRDRIADDYLPRLAVLGFRLLCRRLPNFVIANSGATLRTLSRATADQVSGTPGVRASTRMRVVHDGIPAPSLPASLEANSASPLIGLVGRISPWKGQHIFIKAASLVIKQFPRARFEIIGSALFGEEAYERQVREQVKTLGLEVEVEFTGFCDDVYRRIQKLSILVHASTIGEPFGQVVVEGMVLGKPVVATRGGGVPEIVVDGETGILAEMGDAQGMAEAICELLADPLRAHKMGQAARERALQHFSIEKTARGVEDVYCEMLS